MKNCKEHYLAKVAKNKSLLKEYVVNSCRKVYLNDNDEFQIYLHNPYDYTIGAEIGINNKMLTTTVILRPGEKIWLERYLPSINKFKFSTYMVDDDKETRNAIANNGVITVNFYRERENWYYTPYLVSTYTNVTAPWKDCYTHMRFTEPHNFYSQNTVGDSITIDNSGVTTTATFASTNDYCLNDSGVTCAATAATPKSGVTCAASSNDSGVTRAANPTPPKSSETGRIEHGSYSGQQFQYECRDFEFWPFASERIQILPNSTKPIYKNDTVKKYCHECGRKVKERFKFCPFCGARLD